MRRHIEVWLDETSDPTEPMWCVSLCAADGDEIMLLSTHEIQNDAIEAAHVAGCKLELEVFARGEHGAVAYLAS